MNYVEPKQPIQYADLFSKPGAKIGDTYWSKPVHGGYRMDKVPPAVDPKDVEIAMLRSDLEVSAQSLEALKRENLELTAELYSSRAYAILHGDDNQYLKRLVASLGHKYDLAAASLEIVNEECEQLRAALWVRFYVKPSDDKPRSSAIESRGESLARAMRLDVPLNAYGRKD